MSFALRFTLYLLLISCFFLQVYAQFKQNTYRIVHEQVGITKYNQTSTLHPFIDLVKINETTTALNASAYFTPGIKKNMPVTVHIFRFVSKKFRAFPFDANCNLCAKPTSNIFGVYSVLENSNFKGCPTPPGEYYVKEYVLQEETFPPHLPLGRYRIELSAKIDDVIFLVEGWWEGSLVPKIPKNK